MNFHLTSHIRFTSEDVAAGRDGAEVDLRCGHRRQSRPHRGVKIEPMTNRVMCNETNKSFSDIGVNDDNPAWDFVI